MRRSLYQIYSLRVSYSSSWLKLLVHTCRRIACGSRTPRLSTTSFRNQAICMRSQATPRNGYHCCPIVASCRLKVDWPHDQPRLTSGSADNPTGDVHKRHRRAMSPAFGLVEAKSLLPYFMNSATKAREPRLHLISNADQVHASRWRTSGVASSRTASPGTRPLSM